MKRKFKNQKFKKLNQREEIDQIAFEIWATAQMKPSDSICDAVSRIKEILKEEILKEKV